MTLPAFKYHPAPLKTGVVKPSAALCAACGAARGFIYVGPVYGANQLREQFCPWCIADGSAAERFSVEFTDDHSLRRAHIEADIVAEVSKRTPGFVSWQGEDWQSHCGDACAFLGDLPSSDLRRLSSEARVQLDHGESDDQWEAFLDAYVPGGDPAIYWFMCRHCGKELLAMDCS
jgi:uncharacterized protein CbrC (UPF0167 family)